MNKKLIPILLPVLTALSLCLMAFTPLPPALSPTLQATSTPIAGQQVDKNLSFALQREQNWLERQQLHLNRAAQVATKAQTLIDKAQAKGVDVTDLNKALADFNTTLASARASHDQAASILSAKNGFDANNNVTDRQAAHQTVLDARNNLRQAHLTLVNAVLTLRTTVQDWRMSHQK